MELKTKWMGTPLYYAEETDSTNDWAKREAAKGAPSGALFLTDSQTKGKGRRGRSWADHKGNGLAMSLLLRPDIRPEKAPMLTIVMGVAAALAIREVSGHEALIKWPNDLVMSGRKLTGILTEMTIGSKGISSIVIGVGVNLNMEEFPEDIRDKATSLKMECGRRIDRDELAAAILKYFEKYYEEFLNTGSLSPVLDIYNSMLVNRGREVVVLNKEGELRGRCEGINESGELLVEKQDGVLETIFAGEVSVRGIYGYV